MADHICDTCGDATLGDRECAACRPAITWPGMDEPPNAPVAMGEVEPASGSAAPSPDDAVALGATAIAGPVAEHGTVVDTGPAPAAGRLLDALRDLRRFAAENADADEESTFTRLAYRAKRDTLDLVIHLVAEAIPDIEAEAMDARPMDEPGREGGTASLSDLPARSRPEVPMTVA